MKCLRTSICKLHYNHGNVLVIRMLWECYFGNLTNVRTPLENCVLDCV